MRTEKSDALMLTENNSRVQTNLTCNEDSLWVISRNQDMRTQKGVNKARSAQLGLQIMTVDLCQLIHVPCSLTQQDKRRHPEPRTTRIVNRKKEIKSMETIQKMS